MERVNAMNRIFTIVAALGLAGCAGEFNPDLKGGTGTDGTTTTDTSGTDGSSTDGSTDDTGSSGGMPDMGIPDGCGDGEAQGQEECDGLDLRGAECTAFASPGSGNYSGGSLACNEDCTLDHDACTYCGDGEKNHASEQCDGEDMGSLTCEGEGFDGGKLSCDDQCGLVESACENCEGNKTGMYGAQAEAQCGGVTGSSGFTYSVCVPPCQVDADCIDPDLAICENQPVCDDGNGNPGACHILCEADAECPGGMRCLDSFGWCVWEI